MTIAVALLWLINDDENERRPRSEKFYFFCSA